MKIYLPELAYNQNHSNILDEPITAESWDRMLQAALIINDSDIDIYTFGLATNGYMSRDKAIAGLIKILHKTNKLPGRDALDEERLILNKTFADSAGAFDTTKLAIALSEGLVTGYPDGSFRPGDLLTNAETAVLINRVINKYE